MLETKIILKSNQRLTEDYQALFLGNTILDYVQGVNLVSKEYVEENSQEINTEIFLPF